MSDETQQPTPELVQSENPVSEPASAPVSPDEPTETTSNQPTESAPAEMPPVAPKASPNPDEAVPVKDQNDANEPFPVKDEVPSSHGASKPAPTPEVPNEPNQPNITVEKHGTDTTITEVMQPEPEPIRQAQGEPTAQMAGNEPFDSAQGRPTETQDDQVKIRKENLKLANEKRQSKKREKINDILNLFSEHPQITNNEVEKLLHVSDATVTRYLETLEKEGEIKQVGKTGKGVVYEKI